MNVISISLLVSFAVNLFLGGYALSRDYKSRLNIFFSLVCFASALWAFSDFQILTSGVAGAFMTWFRIQSIGTVLIYTPSLLNFSLVFSEKYKNLEKYRKTKKYLYKALPFLLYIPVIIFFSIDVLTHLVTAGVEIGPLGYTETPGPLYNLVSLHHAIFVAASLLIIYMFYRRVRIKKKKIQAKYIFVSVLIVFIGAIAVKVIPPLLGLPIVQLGPLVMMIQSLGIAYVMFKQELMTTSVFTLRKKIVSSVLLIVIIVGSSGFIAINQGSVSLEKRVDDDSILLVNEVMSRIDSHIYGRIEILESHASSKLIRDEIIESNKEFDKIKNVEHMDALEGDWISSTENTQFMESTMDNSLSFVLKEIKGYYEDKYNYPVFDEISVTNKYGVNIAQTGEAQDYYQTDEEWWQEAKEKGLSVGDFEEASGAYIISIGIRINDESGNFIGVMKAILDIDEIHEIIGSVENNMYFGNAFLKLFTNDGFLIHPKGDLRDVSDDGFFRRIKEVQEYPKSSEEEYKKITVLVNGSERYYVYAVSGGIRDYEGLGWILTMESDSSYTFAPVLQMTNTMLVFIVISLIASLILGILLSGYISKPVKELRDASVEIGKGNLDTKIRIKSRDEIGELATAFENMTKDLKKSRDEIRKHEKELEKKVKERTSDLNNKLKELTKTKVAMMNMMEDLNETNIKLKEAEKQLKKNLRKLEAFDKEKDAFISIAAHELKTPMTAIRGFSDLLKKKEIIKDRKKRERYLNIVTNEIVRLSKLVTEVLDLSRADLGTLRFSTENMNLKEFLMEVKDSMSFKAKESGLKLELEMAKDLPQIKTDREKLKEVVINLVDNSIKYTKKGRISVKAERDGNHVKISVTDTGIGIPKDKHDKIFKRFYQVDSSYTRKIGGTGLGLSLCEEYIKVLGGEIGFKSKINKGSTFYIRLPIKSKPFKGRSLDN